MVEAGMLDEGVFQKSDAGTPQGGVIPSAGKHCIRRYGETR